MNKYAFLFLPFLFFGMAKAQQAPVAATDTVSKTNPEVTVYAYAQRNTITNTPASVSVLDKNTLQRYETSSFVAAVNTVPGVKMDERSPGSYRISIRGNLLRSTFGVRNVKIYLNGLPYTDASGNTYFNELAINSIDKMTIIKGPGGSMYGAGTGGVILLENDPSQKNAQLQITGGSYGLFSAEGKYNFGKEKLRQSFSFTHQQSDGYRDHTTVRRDIGVYSVSAKAGKKNTISGNFLYSNLFYQTPGGLTTAQVNANPRQARPATATFRSAADQQAAIYLSTYYASVSDEIIFNSKWKNTTGGYFSYTDFKNPTIRNYEQKNEKGAGGRTLFQLLCGKFDAGFGVEYQYSFINTSVYDNNRGNKAALQYHDKIPVHQLNIFAQGSVELPLRSRLTAGLSYNDFYYGYDRVSSPVLHDKENFTPQYIPRISLLKKMAGQTSAYLSYSKGYSPPTIDEIHASNGIFNKSLGAEQGTNYEAGFKTAIGKTFRADISYYIFHLHNTIVSRRDASGADYYVNAGKTNQRGLEFALSYLPVDKASGFFHQLKFQGTGTYVHARFADYQQGAIKYSGNKLTGTPPFVFSLLADVMTGPGIYSNITYTYTDQIPLNDANTFFAKAYNLLSVKLGWQTKIAHKTTANIFAGLQKSFNKNYSLGNDLNADSNRFFNPSALQVFSGGLRLSF